MVPGSGNPSPLSSQPNSVIDIKTESSRIGFHHIKLNLQDRGIPGYLVVGGGAGLEWMEGGQGGGLEAGRAGG